MPLQWSGGNDNATASANSCWRIFTNYIPHDPHSTFGELNSLPSQKTGLEPEEQKLLFKGKEKEDEENLNMTGVKDNSSVMLLEDRKSKERNIGELNERNEMSTDAGEIGDESNQMSTDPGEIGVESNEMSIDPGDFGAESNEMSTDPGEIGVESNEMSTDPGEIGVESNEMSTDPGEIGVDSNEMSKAFEAIAGVRAEVDNLSYRVSALTEHVSCGTKVSNKEFAVSTELLIRQLLKLDNIEAEGEARVQRKDEVRRVQDLMDTLETLKTRISDPSNNNSNDVTSQNNNGVTSQNSNGVASQIGNVVSVTTKPETFDSGVDSLSTPTTMSSST